MGRGWGGVEAATGRKTCSKDGWKVEERRRRSFEKGRRQRSREKEERLALGPQGARERERVQGKARGSIQPLESSWDYASAGRTTPLCTLLSLYVCAVSTLLCPKVCLFAAPHSLFSATFLCVHAELRARYPSPRRVYTHVRRKSNESKDYWGQTGEKFGILIRPSDG